MSIQLTNRAVQLIAFDQNKNPYITNAALNILKSMNTNELHIIAVAGKYRTGKSYILNRVLLNRNNGFNVGHTINACTKGLWMWPELIKLDNKDCLIIDTEGLGSLEEGQSTDLKIFLLALLFSSQLIYNSTGNIDQQAIQSLGLVIQLANILQRQDKYDSQQLVNTFPSFLWLLRDFSLKIQDQKGQKMTTGQYLENALKHQPRTSQAAQKKNNIRKQLRTFFSDRDCFALVRPTQQQKDLQNLSSLDQSKLRPEFVNLISTLRKKLQTTIKPKKIKGRNLSVSGFLELCQYYTKALVDGKLPTISSQWDNLCLGETHRIFQKFQLQHLRSLESQENTMKLQTKHQQIIKNGLQAIDKSFLGKLQKQLFRERFQRKLQSQLNDIKMRINSKKGRQLTIKLQAMQQKNDNLTILQRYQAIIIKMSQISQNINSYENYCQLYLYLCQFARNLLHQGENERYTSFNIFNTKQNNYLSQINNLKEQLINKEQEYKLKLKQISINIQQKYKNDSLHQKLYLKQQQIKKIKNQNQKSQKIIQKLNKNKKQKQQQLQKLKKQLQKYKQIQKQLQIIKNKLQKQISQKDIKLHYEQIKIRKINRQKDILKNRYQLYLQQNIKLNNQINLLQNNINFLEIKIIKKNQEKQIKNQMLNLKYNLISIQKQKKILFDLFNSQNIIYNNILQIPININLKTFNKQLQILTKQNKQLQNKFNYFKMVYHSYHQFICKQCNSKVSFEKVQTHVSSCSFSSLLEISVSYTYENDRIIWIFQIVFGQIKWIQYKNISQVNLIFKQFGLSQMQQLRGNLQNDDQMVFHEFNRVLIEQFFYKQRHLILNNQILRIFFNINAHLGQNVLYESST